MTQPKTILTSLSYTAFPILCRGLFSTGQLKTAANGTITIKKLGKFDRHINTVILTTISFAINAT